MLLFVPYTNSGTSNTTLKVSSYFICNEHIYYFRKTRRNVVSELDKTKIGKLGKTICSNIFFTSIEIF